MGRLLGHPGLLVLGLCCTSLAYHGTTCGEEARDEGLADRHDQSVLAGDSPVKDASADNSASAKQPAVPLSREATLEEVLDFARTAYGKIDEQVKDYTCILLKREKVDGAVSPWQAMEVKIRHEQQSDGGTKVPFSVYLRFRSPERLEGRSVIFVENRNHGDLIARRGGPKLPSMTVQLDPTGPLAMEGNRYPITEIGFKNLAMRVIKVMEDELEKDGGKVQVWENASVDNRPCTRYLLTHDEPEPGLTYHQAEVWVDAELGIPIYYKAVDFPKEKGGPPQLLEQYAYRKVRINVGLSDSDFDPENPDYGFQLRERLDETEVQERTDAESP